MGNTALMVASADGRTDIVKFLVLKGADIDLKNKVKNTLHIMLLHSYIYILYYITITNVYDTYNILCIIVLITKQIKFFCLF